MDRESEDRLFEFCRRQRDCFSGADWLAMPLPGVSKDELAAAALFLSCVDWYGHEDELRRVAQTLHPGCVGHFAELAKSAHFNCSRFSSMLRARLSYATPLS